MTNEDIVSKLFEELDSRDYDSAANKVDESFKLTGPFPVPFSKEMWLNSTKGLHAAFSDFKFNASNFQVDRDKVSYSVKITGTHDGELAIPGMPAVAATGKSINIPEESGSATIVNGKIVTMEMAVSDHGGLKGILKQLGVQPPH